MGPFLARKPGRTAALIADPGGCDVKQVSLSFGNLGALRSPQCAGPAPRLLVGEADEKR